MIPILKHVITIIAILLLAGCTAQPPTGDAVFVPAQDIKAAEDSDAEETEESTERSSEENTESTEEQSTEAQDIINSLMDRIEKNEASEEETSEEPSQDTVAVAEESSEEESFDAAEEPVSSSVPSAEATVLILEETDLVELQTDASDPDGDTLIFTYTSPVDDRGQWQTVYGDQGEYTVTVTASDGELTTSEQVLLIINKKEEQPVIDQQFPAQDALTIEETETIEFSVQASDLNSDPLTIEWSLDGAQVEEGTSFDYESTYDDAGSHEVIVTVTDGISQVSNTWTVTVSNKNRAPLLQSFEDITVDETDTVVIEVDALDEDGDTLSFSISESSFDQDGEVFSWETDYDSSGSYRITVSASDGEDTVTRELTLTVNNVNRPPVIEQIVAR